MFHVGQKVVCVDDDLSKSLLNRGEIYTVRKLSKWRDKKYLSLKEAPDSGAGLGWYTYRFRPVHTTDISIFEAMLVPTPKEKVEA